MDKNTITIVAVLGIGYLLYRSSQSKAAAQGAAAGGKSAVDVNASSPVKPTNQQSGNNTIADALAGIAGAGSSIGKLVAQNGGQSGLGYQPPGSALWSPSFDQRVDSVSTLTDPTENGWDTGYSSWESGADWNASTDSFNLPSYEDKADLGDYSLHAPSSLDDL